MIVVVDMAVVTMID